MRITVSLDDDLLSAARSATGTMEISALANEGLKSLIERESARRLSQIGGISPNFEIPPRKRPIK